MKVIAHFGNVPTSERVASLLSVRALLRRPSARSCIPQGILLLVWSVKTFKAFLMCNDYGNRIPYSAYLEVFSHLKIRLFTLGGAPNLESRDDIWPTDVAPIIRANKDGAELIQLGWGFPPGRPKGPPVINMRSEKRRFPRGRCLVPVSHFYEFTGKRSPKDKWRFTKVGEDWFCIAGSGGPWRVMLRPSRC